MTANNVVQLFHLTGEPWFQIEDQSLTHGYHDDEAGSLVCNPIHWPRYRTETKRGVEDVVLGRAEAVRQYVENKHLDLDVITAKYEPGSDRYQIAEYEHLIEYRVHHDEVV